MKSEKIEFLLPEQKLEYKLGELYEYEGTVVLCTDNDLWLCGVVVYSDNIDCWEVGDYTKPRIKFTPFKGTIKLISE